MNREALPLLGAISIPILIVLGIYVYIKGFPFVDYLRQIHPIYYIILVPFVLGFFAALHLLRKMKKGV